jgi:2-polyprenyl-6-hydroxyphenyl methylase/3-demethylubiquinone-9 3-methyltransferase
MNPTVDLSEVAKFDAHGALWWDKNGPLKTLHDINPARLAFIKQHTRLQGRTVLDLGCGGGILTEAIAAEGAEVIGIDASQEAIVAATQHALCHASHATYYHTLIEHYQGPSVDIVTCMEMLEHVPDPHAIILQITRFIKPGGYLFLSTINRTLKAYASVIVAAEYVLNLLPKQTHDYNKWIKPHELCHMIRDAGFTLVDLAGLNYNPILRHATRCESVSANYLLACRRDP